MSGFASLGAKQPIVLSRLFVFGGGGVDKPVGDGAQVVGHGHEVFDPVIKAQFAAAFGLIEPEADDVGAVVIGGETDLEVPIVNEVDNFQGMAPHCCGRDSAVSGETQMQRGGA